VLFRGADPSPVDAVPAASAAVVERARRKWTVARRKKRGGARAWVRKEGRGRRSITLGARGVFDGMADEEWRAGSPVVWQPSRLVDSWGYPPRTWVTGTTCAS
jgi:hypothetical protein